MVRLLAPCIAAALRPRDGCWHGKMSRHSPGCVSHSGSPPARPSLLQLNPAARPSLCSGFRCDRCPPRGAVGASPRAKESPRGGRGCTRAGQHAGLRVLSAVFPQDTRRRAGRALRLPGVIRWRPRPKDRSNFVRILRGRRQLKRRWLRLFCERQGPSLLGQGGFQRVYCKRREL